MEKHLGNVPYNATPKTQRLWEEFIDQTLAGNSLAAIRAHHNYSVAKDNLVKNRDDGMGGM
jgi:hypothetical protein